jgi:hypothetical protein
MPSISTVAIVTTLLGSSLIGQQSPVSTADVAPFEGTWVLDPVRSGVTGAVAERRIITIGPMSMRVEIHRDEDAHPISLIYNFDGSTRENAFGEGTATTRLTREETGFLLHTVFTVKNQPITVDELLPAHANGTELAIAVLLRVEHGYEGVAPAAGRTPPNVAKTTKFFNRQP